MKNRRFSFLSLAIVLSFILAAPSSLYAEDEPQSSEPQSSESQPTETPVETSEPQEEPATETAPAEEPTSDETPIETTEETAEQEAADETPITPDAPETAEETNTNEPEQQSISTGTEESNIEQSINTTTEALSSAPTFTLHIRLEGTLLYEGETEIPDADVEVMDNAGIAHSVSSDSLLAALYTIDQAEDSFAITDLAYYESFGAFFMNCITAVANAEPSCGNWIFVVNDVFPYNSIDQYTLQDGDDVYVFFGSQYRAQAGQESITLGQEIIGQAQTYNYKTNAWEAVTSLTLSVIQDNPDNPWSPIIVTSSPTGDTGAATFVLSATGSYKMGIDEDYFMHTAPFTVLEAAPAITTTTPSSAPENAVNNNNSACTTCNTPELVSESSIDETIEKILAYIKTQQKKSGAIQDGATTDWLIMSFASEGIYADTIALSTTTLFDYAKNYSFSSGAELNLCAGYPRHVLALLAAGVDTTDSVVVDLMAKIKGNECFDGMLYGEAGINDDIFALFSLLSTNESISSSEVAAIVASITGDQQADGAFTWNGWAGSDVTGAAINALKYAVQKGIAVDSNVFSEAKNYLKDQQLNDGGWGFGTSDVLTTSWAVMGINALGEGQSDWAHSSGKNPWHVLTNELSPQGYYTSPFTGSKPDWFATKHAIPALNGSTWPMILTPVNEQENSNTCSGTCNSRSEETVTKQATSTPQIPTSTPDSLPQAPTTTPVDSIDDESSSPATDPSISVPPVEENILIDVSITEENSIVPDAATRPSTVSPIARKITNENTAAEIAADPENTNDQKDEKALPTDEELQAAEEQLDEGSLGKKIAEKVFNSAAAGSATVGLFLAWRYLRALL